MCVCFSAEPLEKNRSSLCLALPQPPLTSNPSHPSVHPCCQRMDPVTMTTGGCCHLPGSLCDCASNTGLWKSVEEAGGDGCQALYVTQVTAIDGRLLSSVLKPMSAQRYFKNITVIAVRCSTGKLWMGLYCDGSFSRDRKNIYIYFAIVAKLVIMPCINTISDNALLHFSCFLWGFFTFLHYTPSEYYHYSLWDRMVKHFCCVSCRRCLPFIKISVYFLSQWWSHLPYLPWRRQQRGSPVSMRLHRHFGYSAQELLREVAVVLQHQLLWALPHRVQHRAPTEAPHRGNKGQCPLPCLQQSFFSSFLFIMVGLLVVNECVCMKVWWCFLSVFFLFYISLLACLLLC